MSLPKTFKRAVFKEAGAALTIEEVVLTTLDKGEILVKVEACGVCYSDIFAQQNVMGGGFSPLVPGHELIGRVAAVGSGISRWNIGDRIGAGWHGGHDYAEYCKIRSEAAVRVPEHIDAAKYAPILCAGMTVFNSLRHMDIPAGSTVAVQGLGGVGHLAVQYANKLGYRVVAISRGSEKEEWARKLGAHEYVDASKNSPGEALQKLGSASLVLATAPTAESITPLLKGLGLGYGISVQSWPCGHATDSEEAIEFTELQSIDCIVEKFPLEKANDALDAMLKGTVRFRAVITMD
ncbi:hypothetical protein FQN57_004026 [Myotisia sp. PD_48]|nr:hypothetical protein FQN57_004026 [Myotisia sp. PD_48]